MTEPTFMPGHGDRLEIEDSDLTPDEIPAPEGPDEIPAPEGPEG